jgi:hypothetical protein
MFRVDRMMADGFTLLFPLTCQDRDHADAHDDHQFYHHEVHSLDYDVGALARHEDDVVVQTRELDIPTILAHQVKIHPRLQHLILQRRCW